MKVPEREALRWLLQAEDDCRFVEWLSSEGVFFDKGCFVSQQAGEKALKACLYATGQRRVFGHSLFEMVQDLIRWSPGFQEVVSAAKRLDRFYIATRYPNGVPGGSPFQLFEKDDLDDAVEDLKKIKVVCIRFLEEKGVISVGSSMTDADGRPKTG
jgi:HEPN domain-containing protein